MRVYAYLGRHVGWLLGQRNCRTTPELGVDALLQQKNMVRDQGTHPMHCDCDYD